jgi:hypothetical protein
MPKNTPPKSSNKKAGKPLLNEDTHRKLIIQTLFRVSKPLTRRQIEAVIKVEICTLCLPLLRMVQEGTLYVAYKRPCAISGNACFHYALSSWKGAINAQ